MREAFQRILYEKCNTLIIVSFDKKRNYEDIVVKMAKIEDVDFNFHRDSDKWKVWEPELEHFGKYGYHYRQAYRKVVLL